ncbi:hypothetical protein NDU88_001661 [Pleurodeles waltl]|uniref:Uncharacterized protein n=1 Tax=Pleurodeles waltl TaxID=8319 RepID=A0AAV7W149_PLEWA|nr:hypothetical protein NDU88_001661 [Pleurodeles waltl]
MDYVDFTSLLEKAGQEHVHNTLWEEAPFGASEEETRKPRIKLSRKQKREQRRVHQTDPPQEDPIHQLDPTLLDPYRMQLSNLVKNNRDMFSKTPGRTSLIQHAIRINTDTVVRQRPYRIPEVKKKIMEQY